MLRETEAETQMVLLIQKNATFSQKSPTFLQKSPAFPQKSHLCSNALEAAAESHGDFVEAVFEKIREKSPTFL